MCILIVKPRGAQFPALEAIQNSVDSNPDGFALAYNRGGRLKTYKTMSAKRFVNMYRRLSSELNPDSCGMILHARIATHGALGLDNCHCWTSFAGEDSEMAFAHNGILSMPARDGMTDSETFLRDYFEPAFRRGKWLVANEVIRRKIGSSKFAFIDKAGNIRRFGHFISEHDGCYYSNMSYARYGRARCADPRTWNVEPFAI